LLGYENDEEVKETAIQILVLLQFDDEMLDHNVSSSVAVSLLLAINIVKMNQLIKRTI
jgi:hypothetical protein